MDKKTKIFMIDDEQDLCLLVKEHLESGPYEVTTCTEPLQAEQLVEQGQPDLILLDVVMPKMKGPELVQKFRGNPKTQQIPIIIVSGRGEISYNKSNGEFKWNPENLSGDQAAGPGADEEAKLLSETYQTVDDFIAKPFSVDLLRQVIEGVLAKRT